MKKTLFILSLVFVLSSCVSYEIQKVAPNDTNTKGLRYYKSEPYLLVTETESKIVWLPNYSEEFAIRKKGFIGSAELNVKLQDGWMLTEFGAIIDTKVPETISAVVGVIDAVKGAGLNENDKTTEPRLYKIMPDGSLNLKK